jgi:hypothetical membrane protein
MRFLQLRSAGVILGAALASLGWIGSAFAASPQVFPVQPHLVPMVVAAVFVLPAAAAGLLSGFRRLRQGRGFMLAIGLLAAAAVAIAVYRDPQFLASIRV